MNKMTVVATAALVAAAGMAAAAAWQPADKPSQPAQPIQPSDGQPAAPAERQGGLDMAGLLVSGLESTPGCLGVDAGQFRSGKLAIMAWFENKEAVLAWYNSPIHRRMASRLSGAQKPGEALAHITDDETPILVIASMTPAADPGAAGGRPFSQIAIELYAPLPGGAYLGGRMAPEGFEVPHMRTMREEEATSTQPE